MSNNSLLPSHTAIFLNRLTNWLSVISLIIVVIVLLSAWTIRYSVSRDCSNYYKRTTGLGGMWIHVEVGSKDLNCPQPYLGER